MIHILKIWPQFYSSIADEKKRFEIRKNDRGYRAKDILILREYDPDMRKYTDRVLSVVVDYILSHDTSSLFSEAIHKDYVVMSIRKISISAEIWDAMRGMFKDE